MTLLRRVSHNFFHYVSIAETESWVLAELNWNKRNAVMCSGYAVTVCLAGGFTSASKTETGIRVQL